MKIFITGSTGFLGSHLIKGLSSKGYEIIALTRKDVSSEDKMVKFVKGTLEEIDHLQVPDFDICIHLAWGNVNRKGVGDEETQRKNIDYEMNLLRFSKSHGCMAFIDAGSRQEYAPSNNPLKETDICKPVSAYGKCKLLAYERVKAYCKENGIQYIHFRIFSIYGVGDHPWSLINSTIDHLMQGKDMPLGKCQHRWSFLYISDFVDAFCRTIEILNKLERTMVFNLGSEDVRTLSEFVNDIKSMIPSTSKLQFGQFKENVESVFSVIPDLSLIHKKTGWKERISFEQGINEIIKNKLL